jgi:hypothetical protein
VIERFVDGWNCHHARAFAEDADFRGDAQPWSDSTPAPGKFRNQESMSTRPSIPFAMEQGLSDSDCAGQQTENHGACRRKIASR